MEWQWNGCAAKCGIFSFEQLKDLKGCKSRQEEGKEMTSWENYHDVSPLRFTETNALVHASKTTVGKWRTSCHVDQAFVLLRKAEDQYKPFTLPGNVLALPQVLLKTGNLMHNFSHIGVTIVRSSQSDSNRIFRGFLLVFNWFSMFFWFLIDALCCPWCYVLLSLSNCCKLSAALNVPITISCPYPIASLTNPI